MNKVIVEARLIKSECETDLFYLDDGKRHLYMNLKATPKAARVLKPHVGQIVTISVEVPEETPCCSPDFEERVLEVIRDLFTDCLKEQTEKEVDAHIEWARRQIEKGG